MNQIQKVEENPIMFEAKTLVSSGFLPDSIKTPQQAYAIISLGRDLGLQPWNAILGINVIRGKPTLSAQLMLSLIYKSGEAESIEIDSKPDKCTVIFKRKGQPAHTETFSIAEAKKANLMGNSGWVKYPQSMCKWRAISFAARTVFPDVISGLYTPEEQQEISNQDKEQFKKVEKAKNWKSGYKKSEVAEVIKIEKRGPKNNDETEGESYIQITGRGVSPLDSKPENPEEKEKIVDLDGNPIKKMTQAQRRMIWSVAKERFQDVCIISQPKQVSGEFIRDIAKRIFNHDSASEFSKDEAAKTIDKITNATVEELTAFIEKYEEDEMPVEIDKKKLEKVLKVLERSNPEVYEKLAVDYSNFLKEKFESKRNKNKSVS